MKGLSKAGRVSLRPLFLASPWSDEQHGHFTRRGIVSDLINFLKSHGIEKATLIGVRISYEGIIFKPDVF